MKIKTQDLTGPALDWAVFTLTRKDRFTWYLDHEGRFMQEHGEASSQFSPSTLWQEGGPIIEREGILFIGTGDGETYNAWIVKPYASGLGPTHLIAAMRCYVASKLGDEVDIPEELL